MLSSDSGWTLNKIQLPPGCHLALTLPTAKDWRGLVDAVKAGVAKCVPSLSSRTKRMHSANLVPALVVAVVAQDEGRPELEPQCVDSELRAGGVRREFGHRLYQ